ncbi:MAG: Ig-like domain-containing protein, partial [Oscillospiraceae bacterium]|nr:Ig-like domain-containing protein [Oscillospiraceae bacterium]
TMYGQGNHNLSIADIDNDGKDEIVWGSACLDDDGHTVLGNTRMGHGDALHVSDFNNDGIQEAFSVKEKSWGFSRGADFRVAETGKAIWSQKVTGDNGRGVMDNIDDAYAAENPDGLAIGWSAIYTDMYDLKGNSVGAKPAQAGSGDFCNFLVYWDGDLGRELLDANIIQKYDASTGQAKRFYGPSDGYTLSGLTNNSTKRNYSLVADIWGDWREEIIMPVGDSDPETAALRIFTSIIPTEYRLTTLMHDCQYREAIAWQNVAYNQPPHTSYYVGSAALATDAGGNKLNYLAPETPFTKVTYESPGQVDVTGITLSESEVTVENGKTVSVSAIVEPFDAANKSVVWTSSNEKVAVVSNGVIKGTGAGKAIITATTKDGGFTAECKVTVFSNPVESVSLSEKSIVLGLNTSKALKAEVKPDNASDKSVKWVSANPEVASVSENGTVTGVGFGSTFVYASSNDNDRRGYCFVRVKPIEITDFTGENKFVTSNTTSDALKFTGTANGITLNLNQATDDPIEYHKDFVEVSEGKAELSFDLYTNGAKISGGDYIWKEGHGYTSELKFLDTEGKNILNILEEHTTSGNATKDIVADGEKQNVSSSWKKTADGNDPPWNRSAIRWRVNIVFDYDNDTATATVQGCDSSWEPNQTWVREFTLNGAKFKTLQYKMIGLTDWVSGSFSLKDLTYAASTTATGNTTDIYERGTAAIPWAEADIEDWTQTGTEAGKLSYDAENDRIWYNIAKPGADYSAKKSFKIEDGAIVMYDIDWHFGNSMSRNGNYEYIQFGDSMRLGWNNDYKMYLSTDGGETWRDSDGDGTPDSIFEGKEIYTKNVKAVFNTATKEAMLYFGGTKILDYRYSETEDTSPTGADYVIFGFSRAGGEPPEWVTPNGLDKIRVAQFIPGAELPDPPEPTQPPIPTQPPEPTQSPEPTGGPAANGVNIIETDGNKAEVAYDLVDYGENMRLIGALYDIGGNLLEVKSSDNMINDDDTGLIQGKYSFEFTGDTEGCIVKVFMWNSLDGMKPLSASAVRKPEIPEETETPE